MDEQLREAISSFSGNPIKCASAVARLASDYHSKNPYSVMCGRRWTRLIRLSEDPRLAVSYTFLDTSNFIAEKCGRRVMGRYKMTDGRNMDMSMVVDGVAIEVCAIVEFCVAPATGMVSMRWEGGRTRPEGFTHNALVMV